MAGRQEREGPMGELRDRMEADLRLRGYAEKTRVAYVSCVRAFARPFRRSPAALGEDEVRAYLTYLGDVRPVRPATQGVHAAALRFLYRITLHQPELAARVPRLRRPQTLPAVLSVEEVGQVLGAITAPKYRALFLTCYGAGLRIGEALCPPSRRYRQHADARPCAPGQRWPRALRHAEPAPAHRAPHLLAPRAPPGPVSLPRRHARPAALARRRPAGAPPRRRAVWHREARHAPYAPALLRHPSPRGRRRAPHDPASPRPSLDPFHGPLHLRLAQSARPRPAPA